MRKIAIALALLLSATSVGLAQTRHHQALQLASSSAGSPQASPSSGIESAR